MHFTLAQNTPVLANLATRPVQNAIGILRRDLATALTAKLESPAAIRLTVAQPEEPLEQGFSIEACAEGLLVNTRCSLGAVYALLYISREFLGVQPFWFWAGLPPDKRETAPVPAGQYTGEEYAVRFRGWFLNDEVLLAGWQPDASDPELAWRMAFEALLRCGGNMAIPGTDRNSRLNRRLAGEMGLWVTHHHAEPLGAELFLRAYPGQAPSYRQNKHLFLQLWRQAVQEQAAYNVVWALGFRGQGDRPFWADDPSYDTPEKRGALISEVVADQRALVHSLCETPICCINIYGEIAELYRQGHLALPHDVICIWADSGYGKMVSRRQGNHNPRVPALPPTPGAHGIYYHASFYDLQASNHITMLPNPAQLVCSELENAFDAGANDYLVLNCGNIRPHLYILDLVARLWAQGRVEPNAHRTGFARTYLGEAAAPCLEAYAKTTIQYGPHADEKAGEQIYHYPVRQLTAAWMANETACVDRLRWLCGERPLAGQLACYASLVQPAVPAWRLYRQSCSAIQKTLPDKGARQRMEGLLYMQALIHESGAKGAALFCESFAAAQKGNLPQAFCLAWLAKRAYARTVAAFDAEQGLFRGFYSNDCLTDVRLTVQFMDTLLGWLRIQGEGADFHAWHREYLMPKQDKGVVLITNFERPLGNDALARGLCEALEISPAL